MICSRCSIDQPPGMYPYDRDLWQQCTLLCSPCRARLKRNREDVQVRRHGIAAPDRALIAAHQGGCRICHRTEPGSKGWVIDHDRSCCAGDKSCPKCRRGVLCQWCNSILGYAFDSGVILSAAQRYLAMPRACDWHMPLACTPGMCTDERNGRTNGDPVVEVDEIDPSPDAHARNRPSTQDQERQQGQYERDMAERVEAR